MSIDFKVGAPIDFEGAIGLTDTKEVFRFKDDFMSYTAANTWQVVTTEAGGGDATEAVVTDGSAGPYGVIKITNDAGANDSDQIATAECIKLEATKPTYFRARVQIDDTGLAEWFCGLTIAGGSAMETDGDPSATDYIGFVGGPAGAGAADKLVFENSKDSTITTSSTVTIADDTWYVLEFLYDGTNVIAAVDGTVIATHTTNIPNDEFLSVCFAINNSTAASRYAYIDYIEVLQVK